jgi:hypothetical protein
VVEPVATIDQLVAALLRSDCELGRWSFEAPEADGRAVIVEEQVGTPWIVIVVTGRINREPQRFREPDPARLDRHSETLGEHSVTLDQCGQPVDARWHDANRHSSRVTQTPRPDALHFAFTSQCNVPLPMETEARIASPCWGLSPAHCREVEGAGMRIPEVGSGMHNTGAELRSVAGRRGTQNGAGASPTTDGMGRPRRSTLQLAAQHLASSSRRPS